MSDDRRADARDRRLGDMDLDTNDTDERPRRKGRASLDEFDFSDLPERRGVVSKTPRWPPGRASTHSGKRDSPTAFSAGLPYGFVCLQPRAAISWS